MSFNNRKKEDKETSQIETDFEYLELDNKQQKLTDDEGIPYLSLKRKRAREYAQSRGFDDEYHMDGWLYFNRLGNDKYSQDVDVLHSGSNGAPSCHQED